MHEVAPLEEAEKAGPTSHSVLTACMKELSIHSLSLRPLSFSTSSPQRPTAAETRGVRGRWPSQSVTSQPKRP
eukprot:11190711-Lingulodinium_polyedra.AAC.1